MNKANRYRYIDNCQSCVVAHEACLRGLDVTAMEYIAEKGNVAFEVGAHTEIAWINPRNGRKPNLEPQKGGDIARIIDKQTKSKGRYHIGVDYNQFQGHIITAERLENGDLIQYDPYNNKSRDLQEFALGAISVEILKVDKLLFNNDIVGKIVKPYTKGR